MHARPRKATWSVLAIPDAVWEAALRDHAAVPMVIDGTPVSAAVVIWNDHAIYRAIRIALIRGQATSTVHRILLQFADVPDYSEQPDLHDKFDELSSMIGVAVLGLLKAQAIMCGICGRLASVDEALAVVLKALRVCNRPDCHDLFLRQRGQPKDCPACRLRTKSRGAEMHKRRRMAAVKAFAVALRARAREDGEPLPPKPDPEFIARAFFTNPDFAAFVNEAAEIDPRVLTARRRLKRYNLTA
jgi:hypothetical protein